MPVHSQAIGDKFNVVAAASGVHILLQGRAAAVTFVVFDDAGDQAVTLKESQAGSNEANLAVIDTLYKCPGVGGTWTEVTQTAAATYDHATDATNDMIAFTVNATQLSDGFDSLELTVTGTGPVTYAIIHGLNYKRNPPNLPSSV